MTGDTERFMRVAGKHLNALRRCLGHAAFKQQNVDDHALVIIITLAAAVEAAVNLCIALPPLFIQDPSIRRYVLRFMTEANRAPMPAKIKFITGFCPVVGKKKLLLRKLNELLELRNSILHSSPDYAEPIGLPHRMPRVLKPKHVKIGASLSHQTAIPWTECARYYDSVSEFLKALEVFGTRRHFDFIRSSEETARIEEFLKT
jgi:hypothetical protein